MAKLVLLRKGANRSASVAEECDVVGQGGVELAAFTSRKSFIFASALALRETRGPSSELDHDIFVSNTHRNSCDHHRCYALGPYSRTTTHAHMRSTKHEICKLPHFLTAWLRDHGDPGTLMRVDGSSTPVRLFEAGGSSLLSVG